MNWVNILAVAVVMALVLAFVVAAHQLINFNLWVVYWRVLVVVCLLAIGELLSKVSED